jgi:hypothetical protein
VVSNVFEVAHKIRVHAVMVPRVRRVAADDQNRGDCGQT